MKYKIVAFEEDSAINVRIEIVHDKGRSGIAKVLKVNSSDRKEKINIITEFVKESLIEYHRENNEL